MVNVTAETSVSYSPKSWLPLYSCQHDDAAPKLPGKEGGDVVCTDTALAGGKDGREGRATGRLRLT